MTVTNLNTENFEKEVINSEKTVLIDFWASWCGPCKMMSPVVDQIAEELNDSVKVCKVNIDEEQNLAVKYNVMSIPTFVVIKDGKEVGRTIGVQDKNDIINIINS
jgi:thioredoxin 1